MILTGPEIISSTHSGKIVISPFQLDQVNPNSYNVRLGSTLRTYDTDVIDAYRPNPTRSITMDSDGFVLRPVNEVLLDDAAIPGGTAPGGGGYNQQAFTDNAGPPGQTFTAPATKHLYALTAISVKGAGDGGGGAIDTATWSLEISEVSGFCTSAPMATTFRPRSRASSTSGS